MDEGNTVVVGVDGSEASEEALAWALDDAAAVSAEVVAVGCWMPSMGPVSPFGGAEIVPDNDLTDVTRDMVRAEVSGIGSHGPVGVEVREGRPSTSLLDAAAHHGAAELVVGSRGMSAVADFLLGSVAAECATHADRPVVVVPSSDGDELHRYRRVVVGTDASSASLGAVRWALDYARRHDSTVRLVSAWRGRTRHGVGAVGICDLERDTQEMDLDTLVGLVTSSVLGHLPAAGMDEAGELEPGSASATARVLTEEARAADLLVVGARGVGGYEGLVRGSVTTQVLHHLVGPTVVVP